MHDSNWEATGEQGFDSSLEASGEPFLSRPDVDRLDKSWVSFEDIFKSVDVMAGL